jgi:hypothetical protein
MATLDQDDLDAIQAMIDAAIAALPTPLTAEQTQAAVQAVIDAQEAPQHGIAI